VTRVLHGLDLQLARGECLGVVGESGCGKSVTWLAALHLLGARSRIGGSIRFDGSEISRLGDREAARLRGKRIAMIFQDPTSALNPVLTIGRQIRESLRLHRGFTGSAATAQARRLLDRVGIADAGRRLDQYPHELSGGMNQRVMIAMALAGRPDLLIADEPTTALDATIQAQILDLLREVQAETGMAMVLISHDLGVVADIADRIAVMYAGEVVESAATAELFKAPSHPYTQGLLAGLPDLDGPRTRLSAIPGTVPSPGARPAGCAFAPRCALADSVCHARPPVMEAGGGSTVVACHRRQKAMAADAFAGAAE
jgi:peptide/nickel transport system ATP-binding protein